MLVSAAWPSQLWQFDSVRGHSGDGFKELVVEHYLGVPPTAQHYLLLLEVAI